MKKFGTPTGDGPGSASEYVGLAGVGTPPVVCGGVGFVDVAVVVGLLDPVLELGLELPEE